MPELDLTNGRWRKSSYSSANGQCVEAAGLPEAIAVRDSKDPAGSKLVFSRQDWAVFIRSVKVGRLSN